jgi:hypothetical protein
MKTTLSTYDFRDAFRKAGRGELFYYGGLGFLNRYFVEIVEDTGEEIELDVIAICCDFAENDWSTIARDYGIDVEEGNEFDDVLNYLLDHTTIVGTTDDGNIVYQQF